MVLDHSGLLPLGVVSFGLDLNLLRSVFLLEGGHTTEIYMLSAPMELV
jgi:hypothetical protein